LYGQRIIGAHFIQMNWVPKINYSDQKYSKAIVNIHFEIPFF